MPALHLYHLPTIHCAELVHGREDLSHAQLSADSVSHDPHVMFCCKLVTASIVASEVRAILEDPQAENLEPSTPDFWLMVAALRRFVVSRLN